MTVTRIRAVSFSQQALGGGKHAGELLIARTGYAQGAGEGFEDGLDLVMIGAAIHGLDVHVGAGSAGEAFKEVGDKLGLQVADETGTDLCIDSEGSAAAQVDGSDGQASPSAMPTSSTV
jgi:hypothetical protein